MMAALLKLTLAVLATPFLFIATVASDFFSAPSEQIAAIAAGVAGFIYLWRTVVRPFATLIHRSLTAFEKLEQLPDKDQLERIADFAETSEARLSRVEASANENGEALNAIRRHLGVSAREGERRARPA